MTDIVERLRGKYWDVRWRYEAADEIERLRGALSSIAVLTKYNGQVSPQWITDRYRKSSKRSA